MTQRTEHGLALSRILIVAALREPVWVRLLQRVVQWCGRPSTHPPH